MNDSHDSPPEHDLRRVFQRLIDGQLTPEEFQRLESRMQTEPALRAEYVKFVDLEACLFDELSQRSEGPVVSAQTNRQRIRLRWVAAVSAAACLVLAWNLWPVPQVAIDRPAGRVAVQPPSNEFRTPAATFVTAPLYGLPDVAVVTLLEGLTAVDMPPSISIGARLKPGILTLREGELQLDLLDGARLLLRGPAELHLVSRSSASLVSGAAGVRVSHSQGAFVLNAPDAAAVAVGTEFAASVGSDRHTQVHVFEGAMEISLLGEDGNTLISQRLTDQDTFEIDPKSRRFVRLAAPTSELPQVHDLDQAQLIVTAAYVQEVERSKPYLYWRFESLEDGLIRDALGGPHSARILADDESRSAIRLVHGAAEFLPSATPRCIVSAAPIPQFNKGDFSLELWVMPTELKTGAILGALLPDEGPIPMHLSFIELAHNTNLVHKPGVIRFLHRQPAGKVGGFNLFSQEVCTPGRWAHVATTKSSDELRLYVNGQLLRSVTGPGTGASDDLAYQLVLGQLGPTTTSERQFHGMIDEVAVYHRVLTPDEISRHYWSIVGSAPLSKRMPHKNDEMNGARPHHREFLVLRNDSWSNSPN